MIELFAGAILGASIAILGLHFSGRLTPRQPETYTGSADNRIAAIGVDIGGNRNAPRLDIDPLVAKAARRAAGTQRGTVK